MKRSILFLAMLMSLLTMVLWSGYASAGHTRGKLSDAMEKASTENKGSRELPSDDYSDESIGQSCLSSCLGISLDFLIDFFSTDSSEPESQQQEDSWPTDDEDETSTNAPNKGPEVISDPPQSSESFTPPDPKDTFFIFDGGFGLLKGNDLHALQFLNIGFGQYINDQTRFELYIGGAWASVDDNSDLDAAIKDSVGIFSIGAQLKYFITPRHTFLGVYALVGIAYKHLCWSYENPIIVEDETIHSDDLGGVELYTGAGLNLLQYENFQVGLEVLPSFGLWGDITSERFENDVFGPFSAVKFRTTFTVLF